MIGERRGGFVAVLKCTLLHRHHCIGTVGDEARGRSYKNSSDIVMMLKEKSSNRKKWKMFIAYDDMEALER